MLTTRLIYETDVATGNVEDTNSPSIFVDGIRNQSGVVMISMTTGDLDFTLRVVGRVESTDDWFTIAQMGKGFTEELPDGSRDVGYVEFPLLPEMRLELTGVAVAATVFEAWFRE